MGAVQAKKEIMAAVEELGEFDENEEAKTCLFAYVELLCAQMMDETSHAPC